MVTAPPYKDLDEFKQVISELTDSGDFATATATMRDADLDVFIVDAVGDPPQYWAVMEDGMTIPGIAPATSEALSQIESAAWVIPGTSDVYIDGWQSAATAAAAKFNQLLQAELQSQGNAGNKN